MNETQLGIRPLDPGQRDFFANEWSTIQDRFMEDPGGVVSDADFLVQQVMEARGYPVRDFEQRAADLSLQHADLVQNYRAAHQIAHRNRRGAVSIDDLRKGLLSYRALFQDLLGGEQPQPAG